MRKWEKDKETKCPRLIDGNQRTTNEELPNQGYHSMNCLWAIRNEWFTDSFEKKDCDWKWLKLASRSQKQHPNLSETNFVGNDNFKSLAILLNAEKITWSAHLHLSARTKHSIKLYRLISMAISVIFASRPFTCSVQSLIHNNYYQRR